MSQPEKVHRYYDEEASAAHEMICVAYEQQAIPASPEDIALVGVALHKDEDFDVIETTPEQTHQLQTTAEAMIEAQQKKSWLKRCLGKLSLRSRGAEVFLEAEPEVLEVVDDEQSLTGSSNGSSNILSDYTSIDEFTIAAAAREKREAQAQANKEKQSTSSKRDKKRHNGTVKSVETILGIY